jgi:BirA family biotin operon repressor/biotin-[acetyl-CoA-carboxylase] ligase
MTKDKVLAILKRSGSCVSGEEMSRALGISRAAVNAAVMALRSDGYEIGSGTNRGYELKNAPDRLNMGELMALLPEERLKTVVCLDSVDSTNDRLRAMAMDGAPDGQIVLGNAGDRKGRPYVHRHKCGGCLRLLPPLSKGGGPPAGGGGIHSRLTRGESSSQP